MKTVEDIVEIWGRKDKIVLEIITTKLKEISFHDDGGGNLIKELDSDNDTFVFFNSYPEIGFGHKKSKFSPEKIKELENILKSEAFANFITYSEGHKDWVFGTYNSQKLIGTYDNMFIQLKDILSELEKRANKVLG